MTLRTTFLVLVLIVASLAQQQQVQDQAIVFDVAQFLDNRGSFGIIVTPEPSTVTIRPVTNSGGPRRDQCNCVPYHACDNNVRSTDVNSDGRVEVSFFNGTCGHYLDVCCGRENLQAVPNTGETQSNVNQQPQGQKPITPTPTKPSTPVVQPPVSQPNFPEYQNRGCGIRNDGGLDFTVNDVDVSYHKTTCQIYIL